MGLVFAPMVVVVHPVADVGPEFAHRVVAPQPDLLILQTSPQTLDEDVVHPAPLAIHADRDPVCLERGDPIVAGELTALVGVEGFRSAPGPAHGFIERSHAEAAVHRVAQLPGEHCPAVPIHDRHEVGMPLGHRNIGDVRAPDFVDLLDFSTPQ